MTLRSARLTSDSLPLPLALILLALCLACGVGESDSGSRPDLILISIDTLRADRLGAYGYDRDTSPTLDALAARGVRFETVIAESNWTLPSHMTLFTGLPPAYHGVTEARRKLRGAIPTLAGVLRDNGYRTFGVNGGGFLDARYGFSRGFERYALHAVDFPMALRMAARRIERFGPDECFF